MAGAWAATYTVTTVADNATSPPSGSLREAILSANSADGANTINFSSGLSGTITLTGDLPALQDDGLTIDGAGATIAISGNNTYRCFLVGAWSAGTSTQIAASVTIANLTFSGCLAQGGASGAGGMASGGGGAGLGGAIFVADLSTVTLSNVGFSANSAVGGAAGTTAAVAQASGGGGMGGNGGARVADTNLEGGSGGGGLGVGADGGASANAGLAGIATGSAGGGAGYAKPLGDCSNAGAGGANGGGGGGGVEYDCSGIGGGGGVGGATGSYNTSTAKYIGSEGGFGGGGGGFLGAAGGFGGGGGAGFVTYAGGAGGFGGGGGGGANTAAAGTGGFGGGNGVSGSPLGAGGGGLGAGGAVFVQQGGTLTFTGTLAESGDNVTAGTGGNPGSNFGSAIFIQGANTVIFAPGQGQTEAISGVIADQTGSGGTGANAGSGGVVMSGAGTLILSGANAYTGATTVGGGTLDVNGSLAAGSTVYVSGGATLGGSGTVFGNVVLLGSQATIDYSQGLTIQGSITSTSLTIEATAGTSQSATITAAFASPLTVTVTNSSNAAVGGITVVFTVPGSGASATLSARNCVTSASTGSCSVMAAANGAGGSYNVTASVIGQSQAGTASFALTNISFSGSIQATGGTAQTTATSTAFAAPLSATVIDNNGRAISGLQVSFTSASSANGASATFSASSCVTGSNGNCSVTATANGIAGSYSVTAVVNGISGLGAASFALTNDINGLVSTFSTGGGTPQTAPVNTAFTTPLKATVDIGGDGAVPGTTVEFTVVPSANGAAAILSASRCVINSGDNCSVTATANSILGSYSVTAVVYELPALGTVSFVLTNSTGLFASGGTPQTALTDAAFASPLTAMVLDSNGNGVGGVTVSFSAPGSGASATLSAPSCVTTAPKGSCSVTATANSAAGSYNVTAMASGISGQASASFALTNVYPTLYVVNTKADTTTGSCTALPPGTKVNSTDSSCTLRAALGEVGTSLVSVTIDFDTAVFVSQQTISLSNGALTYGGTLRSGILITGPQPPVTINGPGANLLTISGNNTSGVFSFTAISISNDSLIVDPTTVTLSGLTIANGSGTTGGLAAGTGSLTVSDSIFTGNNNTGSIGGGAIFAGGSLTVSNSGFANNSNTTGAGGGGIYATGSLSVNNSVFANNSTAGDRTQDSAVQGGGAILFLPTSTASANIANSTFVGNSGLGGGAIYAFAPMTVKNSTFYSNIGGAGGAIAFEVGGQAYTNNTFSSNTAEYGGAVAMVETSDGATIYNNLFADNGSVYGGAGVYSLSSGAVAVSNNVYFNNLTTYYNGSSTVTNTEDDCYQCTSNIDAISAASEPLALSLENYGGVTQTFLPQPGSAAICSASAANAVLAGIATDQRGEALDLDTSNAFTYTGAGSYCPAGSIDAGSVQTDYALSFSTEPEPISPATAIYVDTPYQAAVTLDENRAPFTYQTVSIPLYPVGNGSLGGGQASTVNGVATYTSLDTPASGSIQLMASLPLNSQARITDSVKSSVFSVYSSAVRLTVSASSPQIAGTPFSVTVTALDGNGNVVLDNFDMVNLAITGQTATLGTVTLSYGTGSADVTIPGAGTFTLTGTDMTEPVAIGQSNSIVVNPAHVYIVTNTNDTGTGSLRQALLNAATTGDGSITFSSADFKTPQTIDLLSTLVLPNYTTVQGPTTGSGATLTNLVTLDGTSAGQIMSVDSSVSYASVSNLIFAHGGNASAGAISNAGTLSLKAVTFSNNVSAFGSGIYNTGTLTVLDSTFTGNLAGHCGGGIYNSSGTATVTSSTFENNSGELQGGAICLTGGQISVNSSTITGNFAGLNGGGIFNKTFPLTVSNSIVSGNQLGTSGSPGNYDDIDDLTGNTTFAGNSGGNLIGYYNTNSATPPASIGLAALNIYGGPTETMLPLPGSPAICAGIAESVNGTPVGTDQRGVSIPHTYGATQCYDIGAVQTDYALIFSQEPTTPAAAGVTLNPAPAVELTDDGLLVPYSSGTVTLTDSDYALSGTTAATLSNGLATFSTLQATPVTDDVLMAKFPLTTSISLTATSTPFTVDAYQVSAAKSLLAATPDPAFTGSTVTVTAAVETAGGVPIPGATVTFGAGASTTAGFSSTAALTNASGVATVTVADSVAETITLTATVSGTGLGSLSSTTVQFFPVVANYLWIADSNNKTSAFSASGVPFLTTPEPGGGTGVAIDSSGNVWSLNAGSSSLSEFSKTGTPANGGVAFTGAGLATPTSLAIDGADQVWITNENGTISVFNSSGNPVSATAYTGGALSSPTSVAIDISGNLWIANSGSNSVTEVLGVAAPTTPIATGVANDTVGTRP